MEIIYGTGNRAKIAYMKRALAGLPVEIIGSDQSMDVDENGSSPLENARQKAESYYRFYRHPVFSCDSGLYLWNHVTGAPLPDEEQPGVHVRGRGVKRLSDAELLSHYIGLVRKYGQIRARYLNAICLIWNEKIRAESMDESLGGEPFLLTDIPHAKRVEGFPLDSISLDLRTGKYYFDMENDAQDRLASDEQRGFREFFRQFLKERGLAGDFSGTR